MAGIVSDFHAALDNIVRESFPAAFHSTAVDKMEPDTHFHHRRFSGNDSEPSAAMLTMSLIGCLPDNVQQAIKSYSIRPGRQHVTFAFPFMEESLRACERDNSSRTMTQGIFFDDCLEVVHGFQTFVSLLPALNRSSLPVAQLTLYQRDTDEGICRHFESHFRIIFEKKHISTLWKLPLLVVELSSELLEKVLDACTDVLLEIQFSSLTQIFPEKSTEDLSVVVKENMLRPCFVSYRDLLKRNTEEVVRQLTTTDPAYFTSVLDLLQAPGSSNSDLKKVDFLFKSPKTEEAVQSFWKIWGQDPISRRVFSAVLENHPVGSRSGLQCSMAGISHVPLKEGLQSVIKSLKSQETSFKMATDRKRLCSKTARSTIHSTWSPKPQPTSSTPLPKRLLEKSAFQLAHRTSADASSSRRQRVLALSVAPYETHNYREWDRSAFQRSLLHPFSHYYHSIPYKLSGPVQ